MTTTQHPHYPSIADFWKAPSKPLGRFNDWNERKWIASSTEKSAQVSKELAEMELSPRAYSLYQAARLTDSTGIEFVMMSNAEFSLPFGFNSSSGVLAVMVPCFVPLQIQFQTGKSDIRQSAMAKRGTFIYDGWVECATWTQEHIEKIVSLLDQWLNMHSIAGGYFAYWEPKYYYTRQFPENHYASSEELNALGMTMDLLGQLPQADQEAINRSVAWISAALREEVAVNRFLLLFVSIEALATYIERKAKKDSVLLRFAADQLSGEEKRQNQEDCIKALINSDMSLPDAIRTAYFDCIVGSKALVENHINRLFGSTDVGNMLFREKIGKKTLWELRSEIAHGTTNMLSEDELAVVKERGRTLEEIARNYIRIMFTSLAQEAYFQEVSLPGFIMPVTQGFGGPTSEYTGPTEMAEYYANVEVMSTSVMKVTIP